MAERLRRQTRIYTRFSSVYCFRAQVHIIYSCMATLSPSHYTLLSWRWELSQHFAHAPILSDSLVSRQGSRFMLQLQFGRLLHRSSERCLLASLHCYSGPSLSCVLLSLLTWIGQAGGSFILSRLWLCLLPLCLSPSPLFLSTLASAPVASTTPFTGGVLTRDFNVYLILCFALLSFCCGTSGSLLVTQCITVPYPSSHLSLCPTIQLLRTQSAHSSSIAENSPERKTEMTALPVRSPVPSLSSPLLKCSLPSLVPSVVFSEEDGEQGETGQVSSPLFLQVWSSLAPALLCLWPS